jgi:phosphoserine phosphatase
MIDYFFFDLDGTVTTEEILPKIARHFELSHKIEELTKLTIAGEIPFEHSLRHRVEILSVVPISEVRKIVARVGLNPKILSFIHANADRCRIFTGNLDVWLEDLIPKLGVPVRCSSVCVAQDRILNIRKIVDKKIEIEKFSGVLCAIGDGHNDVGMLMAADVSIAYGGVHRPARTVLEVATHAIYDGEVLCRFLSRL